MVTELSGGDKFNLVSMSFVNPSVYIGEIVSIEGNFTLTNGDGEIGSRIGLGSSIPECSSSNGICYNLEVLDGPLAGIFISISNVDGNMIEVVDDLSTQVVSGDRVAVRELPTIGSVFGADNKFGFKVSENGDPSIADEIYVTDPQSQVVQRYFYSTFPGYVGWLNSSDFSQSEDVILYPDSGILIRVRGPSVSVTFAGDVRLTPIKHAVYQGFNVMPVMNPLGENQNVPKENLLTLGNSNLYDSSNPQFSVTPSANGNPEEADLIYVVESETGFVDRYFYSTFPGYEGWLKESDFSQSDDVVLNSSTSFYIRRRSSDAIEWKQPVNHIQPN